MPGTVKNKRQTLLIVLALIIIATLSTSCVPEERKPQHRRGFAPKPCLSCHKEKNRDYTRKFVHKPMAEKNCEACHRRHGKLPVKSFVVRGERNLCSICHKKMEERIQGLKSVHTVIKDEG
ncbi:MAG: cytochrome c3 family protein, partial [Nitrospirae bacterium]|nr:cytochrome c3 family protein [Nitrospirota bacterium]